MRETGRPASVLLFGATSMLGWSLVRLVPPPPFTACCSPYARLPRGCGVQKLSLDDEEALRRLLEIEHPALIIHCDGVCDVDRCEANPGWAHRANVENLERLLRHVRPETRLIYCSSDHVFGGKPEGGYDETHAPCPISVYGKTRVAAERLVQMHGGDTLIVRSGLAIGPSVDGRSGHLDWLRYRTRCGLPTTVVHDEHRSTVWAEELARRVLALARSKITGLRHVAAPCVSRPELARYLDAQYGLGAVVRTEGRAARPYPHLGRVELRTRYRDALAAPLASVLDATARPEPEKVPA